jgi:hypothetical protein
MSHAYRANSAYLEKRVYPKVEQGKIQGKNNRGKGKSIARAD